LAKARRNSKREAVATHAAMPRVYKMYMHNTENMDKLLIGPPIGVNCPCMLCVSLAVLMECNSWCTSCRKQMRECRILYGTAKKRWLACRVFIVKEANVLCFLSSLLLLPQPPYGSVWLLPVIYG